MSVSILAPRENVAAGIGWMLVTVFWFITLDAIAKYLLQSYPVTQVVWARFFFHLLTALVLMGTSLPRAIRSASPGLQLLRSLLLLATTTLFFLGVRTVPLATASTIMFLSPIFITVLSIPLLGEKVGPRRLMGVLFGFTGAVIVVRPGFDSISAGLLFLLAGSFTNALYQVTTRHVRLYDEPATTLFYTALSGAAVLSFAMPFEWRPPDAQGWFLLVSIGITGGIGHLCLIRAFRLAPAAAVAPFTYTGLLWASLLGFSIFGEIPDLWTLLGAALIIGSGLYIFHREQQQARQAAPHLQAAE